MLDAETHRRHARIDSSMVISYGYGSCWVFATIETHLAPRSGSKENASRRLLGVTASPRKKDVTQVISQRPSEDGDPRIEWTVVLASAAEGCNVHKGRC